ITKFRGNDVFSSEVCRVESLCYLKKSLNDWLAEEQRLTNINNNNKEDFDPNQVKNLIEC
ncbi:571_t:CDS:2, partial [Racocetra persica]